MPVANIDVKDAASVTRNVNCLPAVGSAAMAAALPITLATDDALLTAVRGHVATVTVSITRPADTNAYTANDVWANSVGSPTSGGNTLAAGRVSGGSGILNDILIMSDAVPGTLLQGELWIFDAAVTEIGDNAAFALSDADLLKLVCVVPFTLAAAVSNSFVHITATDLGHIYTCVGTANLRFLVKVKNAYTPASAEVLTIRAKVIQN